MSQALLILSLGPVQDFIATARRCQDLWYGSDLLSELSRAAASVVGPDALVVPGDLSGGAIANEIVTIVPSGTDSGEIATGMIQAIRTALENRMNETFNHLTSVAEDAAGLFQRDVAEQQVRDLIEVYWAAVPLEVDYPKARKAAKSLLAARKNTRDWPQHHEGAGVPKSSLDGARASVIHEDAYRPENADIRRRFGIKGSERLSGVDLLKRHGQRDIHTTNENYAKPTFHSNSHIASGPIRTRLARLAASGQALDVVGAIQANGVSMDRYEIRSGTIDSATIATSVPEESSAVVPRALSGSKPSSSKGYDGYLLYPDRADDIVEQNDGDQVSATTLRQTITQLVRRTGWHGPVQPYYAFLLADGDRMGAFVSKHLTTVSAHKAFSRALDAWASDATNLVESHLGSCIYAGGDDVLALLPLHTALACAASLRESFMEAMRQAWSHVPPSPSGPKPTFEDAVGQGIIPTLSVGLGISHHMIPMRDALDLARAAEKGAKDAGRNSLCIKLQKRGGGELTATGAWDEDPPVHTRIETWAQLFNGEHMPDKVAFAMEQELEPLQIVSPHGTASTTLDQFGMVHALIRRVLTRRQAHRGSATGLSDEVESLISNALRVPDEDSTASQSGAELMARVKSLSAELQIARLFLDAWNEAWGPLPD